MCSEISELRRDLTLEISELRNRLNALELLYQGDRRAIKLAGTVAVILTASYFALDFYRAESFVNEFLKSVAEGRMNAILARAEGSVYELNVLRRSAAQFVENLRSADTEAKVKCYESVFDFVGGTEPNEKGEQRFYHIKTPIKKGSTEMWRYDLRGYSYGQGKPLTFTWVGYTYAPGPGIRQGFVTDGTSSGIPADQYFGSDDFLYLTFGPIVQSHCSFTLDYQTGASGHGDGSKKEQYSIVLTRTRQQR